MVMVILGSLELLISPFVLLENPLIGIPSLYYPAEEHVEYLW